MKNDISDFKIDYIRLARAIAVILIFACHIFQYYGIFLAFHLNAGVYVFLMISGILFSQKNLCSPVSFYLKRAKRILIPYYLFIFIIIMINLLKHNRISILSIIVNIFCLQWFFEGIDKTGHLWYISAYLICCLITPLLYSICKKFKDRTILYYEIFAILMLIVLIIGKIFSINSFSISAYILSYFIGFKYSKTHTENKIYLHGLMIIGFLIEFVRLLIDIFSSRGIVLNAYIVYPIKYIAEPIKILFAISILLMCYYVRNKLTKIDSILKWFDKYSYSVYLTHHIWILGTLSVLKFTHYKILNISIAIVLTIIFAIILQNISNFIINKLYKK